MKKILQSLFLFFLITVNSILAQDRPVKFIDSGYDQNIDKNECSSEVWKTHRKEFYFNFQAVSTYGDEANGFSLIVSEPPPDVTYESIESEAKQIFKDANIFTCDSFIGVDGWRRDVVIEIKGKRKEEVDGLVKSLHKLIFVYDKTSKVVPHSDGNYKYNYPLKSSQILRYMQALYPKVNFAKVKAGVYGVEENKALVVWILDKNRAIDNSLKETFRKFALGTDIILAGINYKNKLAIIGRRRTIPTTVFPPLRFESFKTLALVSQKERENEKGGEYTNNRNKLLAQWKLEIKEKGIFFNSSSWKRLYRRNEFSSFSPFLLNQTIPEFPLGLRYSEASQSNWQYALNYITPPLVNSELGQTLTVADIILKSLSESGDFKSENFKYNLPEQFPKEAKSLKILVYRVLANGKSEFVYNWNNEGLTEKIKSQEFSMLISNSTASMNVAYSPEKQPLEKDPFEKNKTNLNSIYTNFFSEGYGRNPILASVVRYVFLRDVIKEANLIIDNDSLNIADDSGNIGISKTQDTAFENDSRVAPLLLSKIMYFKDTEDLVYSFYSKIKEKGSNLTLDEIYLLLDPLKNKHEELIESIKPLQLEKEITNYYKLTVNSTSYQNKSNWLNAPTLIKSTINDYFFSVGGHNNNHSPKALDQSLIQSRSNRTEPLVIKRLRGNRYQLVVDDQTYGSVKNELLEDINRMQGKNFNNSQLTQKQNQFRGILDNVQSRTTRNQIIQEAEQELDMDINQIQQFESPEASDGQNEQNHNTFFIEWKKPIKKG